MPLGSQRPTLMYDYQPRPLPIGPPSDVSSTAEPLVQLDPQCLWLNLPCVEKELILVSPTMLEKLPLRDTKIQRKKFQLNGLRIGRKLGHLWELQ